jgi:HK97 family phage portal protein
MFNFFNKTAKRRETLVALRGTNPEWTSNNYHSLVSESFQKNVFAFRSINLIASGIASIPMDVKNEDLTINSELTELLAHPNKEQGRSSFITSIVSYLLLTGNAFIYSDGDQLYCLRSDRVKIVFNEAKTAVKSYVYEVDGVRIPVDLDDILHIKFFNPTDDWLGFAPLRSAMYAIDQYNEMSKHNLSILQNGGRPSGCLILKDCKYLDSATREEMRQSLSEVYSGSKNAGRIMLLEGGYEWQEMGLSPKDLDFAEAQNTIAREIVQAFGVPPILVGIRGDASFNNYREARAHFWEDTVLPLAELIRTQFTDWFRKKYETDCEIYFDLDSIPALIAKREKLWEKVSNADFLSTDEKREILGFPKQIAENHSKKDKENEN